MPILFHSRLRVEQIQKQMQCRKLRIETVMFQRIFENLHMPSKKSSLHCNNVQSNYKVWVDGRLLRRFMSCSDTMDDILLAKDESILKHRHLLCKHGTGLHPVIAHQGKMLTIPEYTAYASLLCGERALRLRDDCEIKQELVNDCMITTDSNLYCEQCVNEYRDTLHPKVMKIEALLNLYNALDPKTDAKFETIDSEDESNKTLCYTVSRSFASRLRKIMSKTMEDIVREEKLPDPEKLLHSNLQVISDAIINALRMDSIFQSPDSIDPLVNGKITCE